MMTPEMKYFALGFTSHYIVDIAVGAFLLWVGWYGNARYHRHSHGCMKVHVCSLREHIRDWLRPHRLRCTDRQTEKRFDN